MYRIIWCSYCLSHVEYKTVVAFLLFHIYTCYRDSFMFNSRCWFSTQDWKTLGSNDILCGRTDTNTQL